MPSPTLDQLKNLVRRFPGVPDIKTTKNFTKGCVILVVMGVALLIAAISPIYGQHNIDLRTRELSPNARGLTGDLTENFGPGSCGNIPEPYKTILAEKSQEGPWKIRTAFLAAIGQVESSILSRDPDGPWSTSSAGAQGPFQFLPSTWQSNGRDGGGRFYRDDKIGVPDGRIDIQSIWDASLGATKLLANNGADGNTDDLNRLRDAASRYNSGRSWAEAQTRNIQETLNYVPKVITLFLRYSCAQSATARGNVIFPIPPTIKVSFSNDWLADRGDHQHAGTDIVAPRGAPVVAVTNGTIEGVGLDGFAPNQYKFTLNPGDGSQRRYYYAHVRNLTVINRSIVGQGEQLAEVGVANGVAHLHFGIKVPEGTPDAYFYAGNWWINPYPILKTLQGS